MSAVAHLKPVEDLSAGESFLHAPNVFSAWQPPTDLEEINTLMELALRLAQTVRDFTNQPRCHGSKHLDYLEDWCGLFYSIRNALAAAARRIEPKTREEALMKAKILIDNEITFDLENAEQLMGIVIALSSDLLRRENS